jgi:hypothetical protein
MDNFQNKECSAITKDIQGRTNELRCQFWNRDWCFCSHSVTCKSAELASPLIAGTQYSDGRRKDAELCICVKGQTKCNELQFKDSDLLADIWTRRAVLRNWNN